MAANSQQLMPLEQAEPASIASIDRKNAAMTAPQKRQLRDLRGIETPDPIVKETLHRAGEKMMEGKITGQAYSRFFENKVPVKPMAKVPLPATVEQMNTSLKIDQIKHINAPKKLPTGTRVGARLDIPAYTRHGSWIPTLHEPFKSGKAGALHGYVPTAILKNVEFFVGHRTNPYHGMAAGNIAAGKAKSPIATMDGDYQSHIDDEKAHKMAQKAFKGGKWVQIGMNPKRHSYFYNRKTGVPVKSAKAVIQIGGMVLAYKPVYDDAKKYKFERKKYAKTQDLPFSNALANSQSANSEAIRKLAGRIMQKGGFQGKYRVAKAIGHWPTGSAEGAAHIFHDLPDQNKLHYLASWAGMYTDSPSVLAFHGDNAGKDTLHHLQFKTTDLKQLRMAMKQAGLHIQTIVPGTKSTQVFVYDPLSKLTQRIEQFAGANNAIVRQSKGTGKHIGSDAQDPQTARAKARQHYRQEITNYEAARQSQSPQKANIGNSVSQPSSSGGTKTSPGSGKKGGVNAGSGNRSQPGGALVRGQFYKPGTFKPSINYGSK